MVTKHVIHRIRNIFSSVLAKIHMVTKLHVAINEINTCSVLAKIHMVTKLFLGTYAYNLRSVLAKIHMVTKL